MPSKSPLIFILLFTVLACGGLKNEMSVAKPNADQHISYQNSIKPIIEGYCVSCHSGNSPAGDFVLTSYDKVRDKIENGNLIARINDGKNPMPQSGLMPKELREHIAKWAENGFNNTYFEEDKRRTRNNMNAKDAILHSSIIPISIAQEGFEFFDLMQGHWVGDIFILGQKYDWFSFDYRPIAPSHIHGIYEGGTMGNLFTSFFIADFNGTKTIMARNGGILNGIYRTSYFVLDKVELSNRKKYFRLVDAYGGEDIMWMELEFIDNKLRFNSYTSRFGLTGKPKLHMKFSAEKMHIELAQAVAEDLAYPQNKTAIDFSKGLPMPDWGVQFPEITSASYIFTDNGEDLITLARLSKDPYTIEDMPHLSTLSIEIEQNENTKDEKLIIYLSKDPLVKSNQTNFENGFIKKDLFDGILSFPEIAPNQTAFTFTYLHPGNYFLTVVADKNKDGFISKGDISSASQSIVVAPNAHNTVSVTDIIPYWQ